MRALRKLLRIHRRQWTYSITVYHPERVHLAPFVIDGPVYRRRVDAQAHLFGQFAGLLLMGYQGSYIVYEVET